MEAQQNLLYSILTEMIAVLFGWELCSGFSGDEVAELRGLSFEFSGLVLGVDLVYDELLHQSIVMYIIEELPYPVQNVLLVGLLHSHVSRMPFALLKASTHR